MLLSEIKILYKKTLMTLYPTQEIDSIFSCVADYLLHINSSKIHQNLNKNIQPEAEKKMLQILMRLKKGEPVQYITGITEFYGLELMVDPQVLIPRQETEMLADIALKNIINNRPVRVIDLCTGSGCLAVVVSKHLSHALVTATDISEQALNMARKNASRNSCSIKFIKDDILHPTVHYEKYDYIISNPPYVRTSEKQYMHKNVLDFEPELALFVDDSDPLVFYRAIAVFSEHHLLPGGYAYLEINENLGHETRDVFNKSNFTDVQILQDLQNKNRYLIARK